MQCGVMNHPLNALTGEVERLAGMGFDFIELCMDAPFAHHEVIRENLAAIRRWLAQARMAIVCHLPTFVYTADLTASIRQASLAETLSSLEAASELGAAKAVLHPSAVHPLARGREDLSQRLAAESLEAVVRRGEQLGVRICIENMFPRFRAFFEPAAFVALFRRHPGLELALDLGHAHIGSGDGARALDFIGRFADRIGHLHVSDNRFTQDDHLPLGAGSIDFAPAVSALKRCGYDGTATLEVFSDDPAAVVRSMEKWRSIWKLTP
jgi:sugar phosphate isomerase/epimerase